MGVTGKERFTGNEIISVVASTFSVLWFSLMWFGTETGYFAKSTVLCM